MVLISNIVDHFKAWIHEDTKPLHGPTYLFAGEGTWPVSVDQTQAMLETILDSRSIKQVHSLIDVDKNTNLVVIPGGHADSIIPELGITGQKMSDYVKNGGRFLGICAGAIIATTHIIKKPMLIKLPDGSHIKTLQKAGKLYHKVIDQQQNYGPAALSLYPGQCIAPHIVQNWVDPGDPKNLCAAEVSFIDAGTKHHFKAFHYSGPAFVDPSPEAKILLNYHNPVDVQKLDISYDTSLRAHDYVLTEEKIFNNNPAAALSYPYGAGKIVLTGVHPEINPKTFSTSAEKHGFHGHLPQELALYEPGRTAFINKIFKELDLNKLKP